MTDREYRSGEGEPREHATETYRADRIERGERVTSDGSLMGRGSGFLRGLSWSAIFAGALVALVVMIVLNILGLAIGAATIDVGVQQQGLGIGAGIWWTVSALIALFCGGWVAGRLSQSMDRGEGLLHGIVTWSLFVFASVLALTTAVGQLLGGAFGLLGQQISALLGQTAQPLEALEAALIEAGVDQAAVAEAQAEAIIAAEQAADAIAAGATWAFIALLLGVLCAAFGSLLGAAMPTEGREKRTERTRRVLRPREA